MFTQDGFCKTGEAETKNRDRPHKLLVVSFCMSYDFQKIERELRTATYRSGMHVWEISPSPAKATHSIAFGANVSEETEGKILANGNFVVLNEDQYMERWQGKIRFICFLQAPLENDMGHDPFLEEIAWQWTTDALDSAGARYKSLSGVVSRCTARYFGDIRDMGSKSGIELRVSWTPVTTDILPHAHAFSSALENLAGLMPIEKLSL